MNNDDKKYSMLSAGMITGSLSAVLLLAMGIPVIITLGVAGIVGITCAPLLADVILQDKSIKSVINDIKKNDAGVNEDKTDYSEVFFNEDKTSKQA